MAKRKNKSDRRFLGFFKRRAEKPAKVRRARKKDDSSLKEKVLRGVFIVCGMVLLGALAAGFVLLKRYVESVQMGAEVVGVLELVDYPAWLNQELEQKIYKAARANGEDLVLDKQTARSVQENLQSLVVWLRDVRVMTTHEKIIVEAQWRKPVALVKRGTEKFYVDQDLVVLDYVPMQALPIVEVKGIRAGSAPVLGQVWRLDDLKAAMDILVALNKMDESMAPEKPLLFEIKTIDVSNYDGRQNERGWHVILYAQDNTEIIWGAEFGCWQRHLEASDKDKLGSLYNYYNENGTLLGGAKYINLCTPVDRVPQPVDRY